MKRRLVHLLCLIVLAPIIPFLVIRLVAEGVVELMVWCVEGRLWCQPFVWACTWIEIKLLLPPETWEPEHPINDEGVRDD